MSYGHTQRGGLQWVLWLTSAACLVGTWFAHGDGEALAVAVLLSVAAFVAVLGLCFSSLTVRQDGDALLVHFGSLPLFRRRLPYGSIESAEPGRSKWIDGLGVHWVPGRGWTWNLWGFDCVDLVVDGKKMRLGTDDGERLVAHLRERGVGGASA
jgi:hypothetical protein